MSSTSATPTEGSPLLRPSSTTSSTLTDANEQSNSASKDESSLSKSRGALISVSIYVLIFMLTSNISLLTTIQSPIAIELEAYASVSWFTSAYLISVTSITPLAGRLSQIFTPRIYLFASIVFQCIGTLITSLAPTLAVFLLGRVVTGIGTAAVTPVAFILVTELTSKKRRGLLFGLINTGYTSGVALGAIIAGALEPIVGWRAIFWLQIPFTFTAATVALFAIPRSPASKATSEASMLQKLSRIDFSGTITLITAVVLLLYSLSAPHIQATPIIISLLLFALFLFVEVRWAREPIVPWPILKSRGNLLTGLATIGLMTARWGVLFYTPVYAIAVRNWSPASAGLMLLPTNGGFAVGGILAGWLHIRRTGSFYVACLICYLLFGMTLFLVSQATTTSSNTVLYIVLLFTNGFTTGALLNYTLAHVLHLTLPQTHVIVIPLNAMFRGLSGSFGSSISGGVFLRNLRGTLESEFAKRDLHNETALINKLVGTPALVRSLSGAERESAVLSYQKSLQMLFIAGSVLAIIMALVQAGTGWTAPESPGDVDVLSNREDLTPVVSREPVTN